MLACELWQRTDVWSIAQSLLTLPAFRAWLRQQPTFSVLATPIETYLRCVTRAEWQVVGLGVQLVQDPTAHLVLPAWALSLRERCDLAESVPLVSEVRLMAARIADEEACVPPAFADEEVI